MKKCKILLSLITIIIVISSFCLTACDNNDSNIGAYILADKGTYLSLKNNPDGDKINNLTLLYESDDNMKNTYTMIAVDGDGAGFQTPITLNEIGADCFIKWMSLESTRNDILATYGIEQGFGETLFYLLNNAPVISADIDSLKYQNSGATSNVVRISTTTSVKDTGLLTYIETVYEELTGWDIEVTSAGTGKAIQNAKDGNADLLLVHAKAQEDAFVNANFARTVDGFSAERISFMYNYFVLVGPKNDPANAKNALSVADAFSQIKKGGFAFVSRGDNSGTHTKEISLWKLSGESADAFGYDTAQGVAIYPDEYAWYIVSGKGMTDSFLVANEQITK